MYEYGCEVDRVVDGDTIDVTLDLGFDILFKSRVRLYGIDTPDYSELIASKNNIEDINKAIGSKSLFFLSLEGTYRSMGYETRNPDQPQFTDHCFTGEYPIDVSEILEINKKNNE